MNPLAGGARRAAFAIALGLSLMVALAFLTIPVAAIFVDVGPARLVAGLGDEAATEALLLSLETSLLALAAIVVVGTPAAYLLATRAFRGRDAVVTALELPLVLPPAVAGIALLAALGPEGVVAEPLSAVGIEVDVVLTRAAVVLALIFVSAPFYLRQAQSAFASVGPELVEAARTLGASEARSFARVSVPLALPGLATGAALAWGRAVGEFGATLMFAGSFPGVTRTLPLTIYDTFASDYPAALAMAAMLVAASGAILLTVRALASREGRRA